jgi:hypothetical protein
VVFTSRAGRFGLAMLLLGACAWGVHGRERPTEVVVEPTPRVPSDVVFYTHVLYGGDAAYLVDGRWFRQGVNGWVVFTHEPLELALVRRSLDQTAAHRATTLFDL